MAETKAKKKTKQLLKCKVCKADLPEIAIKNNDPFCSTGCAKQFYGTAEKSST